MIEEPSQGLDSLNIKKTADLLRKLSNHGNTVIITEHNHKVIKGCDYIIELGPESGTKGGQIINLGRTFTSPSILCPSPLELKPKKNFQ